VINGRCWIGGQTDRQSWWVSWLGIFIHSRCDGHSIIDSSFSWAQESLNISLGGCTQRPSGFSPSTQCKQSNIQRHSYFRDIIKNKEIANRHVGFRTRNASQSIWVRRQIVRVASEYFPIFYSNNKKRISIKFHN
jgi:hypothetical protein